MDHSLSIDLFEPGMGPLHRAGLGGLAATIRWINRSVPPDRRPNGRMDFNARTVTLAWNDRASARDFFRCLYGLAFQVRDGLIHLPAVYSVDPTPEVKAELQKGVLLTILQYIKDNVRINPSPKRRTRSFAIDDATVTIDHLNLDRLTLVDAWEQLFDDRGGLKDQVEIVGRVAPGFVERHALFRPTRIQQPAGPAVALHYALLGTLSLVIDGKTGLLLVPDVEDLVKFAERRQWLTPSSLRECRVGSPADGALQAQVRLRKALFEEAGDLPRCLAVRFDSKTWGGGQKTRADVITVEPDPKLLRRFDLLMAELPPRVLAVSSNRQGPAAPYWPRSVLRPFVAENLARGRRWFEGFRDLLVGPGGSKEGERFRQLGYERKGLKSMIDEPWDDKREELLITAVHQAMRQHFGRMWEEANQDRATFGNRFDRQVQEWRIAFAHAKTPDDFRDALADLISRAGRVPVLMESWREIRPLFSDPERWRLNRDLALLALASYQGTPKEGDGSDVGSTNEVDD
jgi:CRISPR-associated protein Cas8a1/Csx13